MTTPATTPVAAPPPVPKEVLYVIGDKLYRDNGDDLVLKVVPDERFELRKLTDTKPIWYGPVIPCELWQQIIAFMIWSYEHHKSEALIQLFFKPNECDGEWAAWAFPQELGGMTVSSLPDHPRYAEERKQFGKGWIPFGSVHHHCSSQAFESGVDKADEMHKDGVHFTVGLIGSKKLDLHCRQVFDGTSYVCNSEQWIEEPEWIGEITSDLAGQVFAGWIRKPIIVNFPEAWKANLLPKAPVTPINGPLGNGSATPNASGVGSGRTLLGGHQHQAAFQQHHGAASPADILPTNGSPKAVHLGAGLDVAPGHFDKLYNTIWWLKPSMLSYHVMSWVFQRWVEVRENRLSKGLSVTDSEEMLKPFDEEDRAAITKVFAMGTLPHIFYFALVARKERCEVLDDLNESAWERAKRKGDQKEARKEAEQEAMGLSEDQVLAEQEAYEQQELRLRGMIE